MIGFLKLILLPSHHYKRFTAKYVPWEDVNNWFISNHNNYELHITVLVERG